MEWLLKWCMSQPTSEFLLDEDFETLWSVSFRWCNREAPLIESTGIPDDVKQTLYRLIRGFFDKGLNLRLPRGRQVPREPMFLFIKDRNPWRNMLWRCLAKGQFNVPYLSKLYVKRSEVVAWCQAEQIAPPAFWVKSSTKEAEPKRLPLENRRRDEDIDRLVCQAIARVYWDADPNIHPAHMASARAVALYGNGKLYRDENTVKAWIAEVDPRKGDRKTGRPEKIPYGINLETGTFAEHPPA